MRASLGGYESPEKRETKLKSRETMERRSQENQLFAFLYEASEREGDGAGGIGVGALSLGGGRGLGGRDNGVREEIAAEADSTFDNNLKFNRRHHSLPREPRLSIRELNDLGKSASSSDDLTLRKKTRHGQRNLFGANRKSSEQKEEGVNGKEEDGGGRSLSSRKMLLRDWLLKQANDNAIPGMRWIDEDDGGKLLRIPWVHESKSSWTPEDSQVFEEWAKHTGKFWSSPENHKRWKSNFRCAINSLPDVEEVRSRGRKSGLDPFKVYRFLPEQPRNQHRKTTPLVGEKRSSRRTIIDERVFSRRQIATSATTNSTATTSLSSTSTTSLSSTASSASAFLSLCSSQITKREESSEDAVGEANSSSSVAPLPAISAPDVTYRQQTMSILSKPSFLPFFFASSSFSSSSPAVSISVPLSIPSTSLVRSSTRSIGEAASRHHSNSAPTSHSLFPNLVPTTVEEMSLDDDEDDDDDAGGGGGGVHVSRRPTINRGHSVNIKEEIFSISISSSFSSSDSSSSSSSSSSPASPIAPPSHILPLSLDAELDDITGPMEMDATDVAEFLQSLQPVHEFDVLPDPFDL